MTPALPTRAERTAEHLNRRMEERHGLTLTPAEVNRIIRGIVLGQAQLIRKQLARRHLYLVALRGKLLGVSFDHAYQRIVTVLPENDVRVSEAARLLSTPMKKWLRESQQAVKEAA